MGKGHAKAPAKQRGSDLTMLCSSQIPHPEPQRTPDIKPNEWSSTQMTPTPEPGPGRQLRESGVRQQGMAWIEANCHAQTINPVTPSLHPLDYRNPHADVQISEFLKPKYKSQF